jgi:hypothetical protein
LLVREMYPKGVGHVHSNGGWYAELSPLYLSQEKARKKLGIGEYSHRFSSLPPSVP